MMGDREGVKRQVTNMMGADGHFDSPMDRNGRSGVGWDLRGVQNLSGASIKDVQCRGEGGCQPKVDKVKTLVKKQ